MFVGRWRPPCSFASAVLIRTVETHLLTGRDKNRRLGLSFFGANGDKSSARIPRKTQQRRRNDVRETRRAFFRSFLTFFEVPTKWAGAYIVVRRVATELKIPADVGSPRQLLSFVRSSRRNFFDFIQNTFDCFLFFHILTIPNLFFFLLQIWINTECELLKKYYAFFQSHLSKCYDTVISGIDYSRYSIYLYTSTFSGK